MYSNTQLLSSFYKRGNGGTGRSSKFPSCIASMWQSQAVGPPSLALDLETPPHLRDPALVSQRVTDHLWKAG